MKTSPKDMISNTQRPSWIFSAAVLLIALCGVTAAQPSESQPSAAGDVATDTPSTEDVFPRVTDPAELRRLATRAFRRAAVSCPVLLRKAILFAEVVAGVCRQAQFAQEW